MAIIGSLFAMFGRFAGRIVNFALGWATILLFGKVEARRQSILGYLALGSLLWVAALFGVLFPDVGTFLIAAVPAPDFVVEDWIRLAMLGLAVLLPLLIGGAAYYLAAERRAPGAGGFVRALARGYPFTLLLAVTIAFLAIVALVRKGRSLARRLADAHVPVIVKPGGYTTVVRDLHEVLTEAGLGAEVRPAPAVLSLPARILDRVAGRSLGGLVPDRLMILASPGFEALIYPSDIAIVGERRKVARARAAIASRLTASPAYLTASSEGQRVEDALAALVHGGAGATSSMLARIDELDEELANLVVPFDEWETLYRQRLQVERDALQGARTPTAFASGSGARAPDTAQRSPFEAGMAFLIVALLALDLIMTVAEALRPAKR